MTAPQHSWSNISNKIRPSSLYTLKDVATASATVNKNKTPKSPTNSPFFNDEFYFLAQQNNNSVGFSSKNEASIPLKIFAAPWLEGCSTSVSEKKSPRNTINHKFEQHCKTNTNFKRQEYNVLNNFNNSSPKSNRNHNQQEQLSEEEHSYNHNLFLHVLPTKSNHENEIENTLKIPTVGVSLNTRHSSPILIGRSTSSALSTHNNNIKGMERCHNSLFKITTNSIEKRRRSSSNGSLIDPYTHKQYLYESNKKRHYERMLSYRKPKTTNRVQILNENSIGPVPRILERQCHTARVIVTRTNPRTVSRTNTGFSHHYYNHNSQDSNPSVQPWDIFQDDTS